MKSFSVLPLPTKTPSISTKQTSSSNQQQMANPSFSLPPLLFLLLITSSQFLPKTSSTTHWEDTQALKNLKQSINSVSITSGSCLSSWDFSFDPCDHLFTDRFTCGFRCDIVVSEHSRVTELTLDPAGYSGSLSSTSFNLPYLTILDLSNNYFSGSIPDSLSNLTRLRQLTLSSNSFAGKIPVSLGSLSSLEELYLDNNHLEGPIPANFNNLLALQKLELQQNMLSTEFPDLGQLKNLSFLDFSNNFISGQVPANLPQSLIEISMRNNTLDGELPIQIQNLSALQVLDLSYNRVTGSVPATLFDHPNLQQLTLSHNKLQFLEQPSNLGTQSSLIAIDLSFNELQGLLPAFMGTMPKLSALSLENNKFTGMIPTQYALKAVVGSSFDRSSSKFERLLLGGNYLFGPIPGPLMELKQGGGANVSLVNNCLFRCPSSLFFCQGGLQKSLVVCNFFGGL